ncbi:MAG TPA: LysR family transcriptional regulator [Kofleriaceae bacterium]|jgi:LysR family transcriptional activator of mexEF-oprN operon
MNDRYGRNLDLNLLRVFVVVAESGSVTGAAQQLYLTQPAVTAALRRLQNALGAPVFARHGRGLVLTNRGERLLAEARPHLQALIDATSATPEFEPRTSERTVRLGISDAAESWLVAPLVRELARDAPHLKLIVIAVQFRTVEEALVRRRVDLAVTVADELPASIKRAPLVSAGYRVVYDPRRVKLRGARIAERRYYEHVHVIVSYNGDLRGFVEDTRERPRTIRCSLPTFHAIGDVISGTDMLATVPTVIAAQVARSHPKLASIGTPWPTPAGAIELLWPTAVDDDPACRFLREKLVRLSAY